jgi:hypothetical protein
LSQGILVTPEFPPSQTNGSCCAETRRLMLMHKFSNQKIWFTALLLAIFITTTGCCPPGASVLGITRPTVTSVAPPNGAAGVCANTIVTATFSTGMDPATLNTSTFTLSGPAGAAVAGAVTFNGGSNTAIFTPTGPLALGTLYTATVTTGARDLFGNAMNAPFVWSFTTGIVACAGVGTPTVVSVTPANGACPNATATARFNEAMDPATINSTTFTLTGPGGAAVAGAVTYSVANLTATFTPTAALALNTLYTATVTTGAKDLFGAGLASNRVWTFTTSAVACQAPVPLGSAANFRVLAGSTVTNTGPTTIANGDLGLSPGTSVTGFPPGTMIAPAVMHITDPIAAQAQLDLTVAYNYTAGLPGGAVLPADISGLTFTPGIYKNASTVILSAGNVTLDAGGNANAVFIFQVGSTLTTLGSTQVVLAGGAQAQNVFWQVGSSATLGTNSIFKGTIMALQSITLNTGANLEGRALARNAAVTMDTNVVH